MISHVAAQLVPPSTSQAARPLRARLACPGPNRILSLAEVQVFSGTENIALKGEAKQISTDYDGHAKLAIDGNTDGNFEKKSVTHTKAGADPWWEVDLKGTKAIDRIVLWNRTGGVEDRLAGYRLELLNEKHEVVWQAIGKSAPKPSVAHETSGARSAHAFTAAFADYEQAGFPAAAVLDANRQEKKRLGDRRRDGQTAHA